MKLATWNVNSVIARLPLVTKWLAEARPDVFVLAGMKCVDEKFPAQAFAELGYQSAAFGQRTYNGVAILARTELTEVQRGFQMTRRLAGASAGRDHRGRSRRQRLYSKRRVRRL